MPNSAAAAYTAACQDPANSCSKELPSAQRYLAQYYLRFSLLDHAAHYAYKCLEHENVSSSIPVDIPHAGSWNTHSLISNFEMPKNLIVSKAKNGSHTLQKLYSQLGEFAGMSITLNRYLCQTLPFVHLFLFHA